MRSSWRIKRKQSITRHSQWHNEGSAPDFPLWIAWGVSIGENMDKIDRLIMKAQPRWEPWQRLEQGNPYMEKTCEDLLNMMCPDTPGGYSAPPMRTREWERFIYALLHSSSTGGPEEISYSALDHLPPSEIKTDQPAEEPEADNKFMTAYERLYGKEGG